MVVLKKVLPPLLSSIFEDRLNYEKLYEVRLRADKPVIINYGGKYYTLNQNGISSEFGGAIYCTQKMIENVVFKAGDYSLYAVNNQIKQGFITMNGGIRMGIAGETVIEDGEIKTIKNFNALNIRIPHEVKGCALTAFKYITSGKLHNSLIISPPGCGKTTFLRDLSRTFGDLLPIINVLLIDERSEIAASYNAVAQLDVGKSCDIISNCTKKFGLSQGIRVMRPDLIITDELAERADIDAVRLAANSGVAVIASAHAFDVYDLCDKSGFEDILKRQVFSRYISISSRKGPGTYEAVYDENLKPVYLGEA